MLTLNELLRNAIYDRSTWLRKWLDADGERQIDKECGHPETIAIQDYKLAFRRGDLATRIIEIYPQETWQSNPDVFETEGSDFTPFETKWDELEKQFHLFSILLRADILSGIGRFGVILFGLSDGGTLDQPLKGIFDAKGKVTTPGKLELLYLRTLDESTVTIKSWEQDLTNPRYGQPVTYEINFDESDTTQAVAMMGSIGTKVVHWTRLLHLADNRTDSEIYGAPRLERCYDRLLDLKKIMGGSGEMFWRGGFPGLAVETQPGNATDGAIDFSEEDRIKAKEDIEQYQKGMKRYLALVGLTAKSLAPQIADPTHHMEAQIRMIAMAWGVPWRMLMGSELGQLASGQDTTAWNKRVRKRQLEYATSYILRPFVQRLMDYGILPPLGPKGLQIDWPDVHTNSDTDKATVAEKVTNAITKYVQAGGDMVISPFHFLTLVLDFSNDEAHSIIAEVGNRLQQDRAMHDAQQQATVDALLNPPPNPPAAPGAIAKPSPVPPGN